MGDQVTQPASPRGSSRTLMRVAVCKDCQREADEKRREIGAARAAGKSTEKLERELNSISVEFTYPESQATGKIDRGGSRSDRCPKHRREHSKHIEGMAVAYVDLETIGEVADRDNPVGPFGGLGPLPDKHEEDQKQGDLSKFEFGMNDGDIVEILEELRHKRVMVLKAGTGTGKSTFAPYRLMDPPTVEDLERGGFTVPENGVFDLIELGPIIVTEPRVAAATGVATFVGEKLSGTGVGPGYPVGYQVSGDRNHDDACRLVFVTDGTMINWLREGRLSKIGTVIVDEAHERSTNIDFIMGYLRRDLSKYPHLRVVITSATFDTKFYEEYFGGPDVVAVKTVPAVKTVGYGMPLFPGLDTPTEPEHAWAAEGGWAEDEWPIVNEQVVNEARFVHTHWPNPEAPPLKASEVRNPEDEGYVEDLHETTKALLDLRFESPIPVEDWKERMPDVLAEFVIDLVNGLDDREIFGDVLGFLPTGRTIDHACERIRDALGDRADVFALLSTLPPKLKDDALSARRKGDKRKVVISTNLAETSLTVEGVRFVVDSGLIAQSEWDPELAVGGIPTKAHSQAGIRQRWGRVGRKAPGWVFPLYTKQQYAGLDQDTPPGSARENLESLVMTAHLGGIDDVGDFPWPAAFEPTTTTLDEAGKRALNTFVKERDRARVALRSGGAVDEHGHPTAFGREAARLSAFGSTNSALAILYADRLACVPEVATVLALLEDTRLVGPKSLLVDDRDWPPEWRLEAARRHRGLATLAEDDASLVLTICAAWERADPDTPPWEESARRRAWARRWWIGDEVLLAAAAKRQEVLSSLSPAMKEEVKRFIELPLLDRARGVLARSLKALAFRSQDNGTYLPLNGGSDESSAYELEADLLTGREHEHVLALRRRDANGEHRISNLIKILPVSESEQATGLREAMRMIVAFQETAKPDPTRQRALGLMSSHPIGERLRLRSLGDEPETSDNSGVITSAEPTERPPTQEEMERDSIKSRKRRRRRFDDDSEATAQDASGELGARRRGIDDDAEAHAERVAIDEQIGDTVPCGSCDECRAGRPDRCSDPQVAKADGKFINDLKRWRLKTQSEADFANPVLRADEPIDENSEYEVSGYDLSKSPPEVQLVDRSAPESDEEIDELPEHEELEPGTPIPVLVGEADSTHSGPVRVFYRLDGRGHFVVTEAGGKAQRERGAMAVSLDRFAFGLLEKLQEGSRLQATVVPTGAKAAKSITLLEVLHRHLQEAAGNSPAVPMLEPSKGRGDREPWAIGTVISEPNDLGRVGVELALVDADRGIRHLASIKADAHLPRAEPGQESDEEASDSARSSAGPLLKTGDTVRIRFKPSSQKLSVAGCDLDEVAEILRHSDRRLMFEPREDDPSRRRRRVREEDTDEEPEVAGSDAFVRASQGPVPRSIAVSLAALDDSPKWQREVWGFWARSHHIEAQEVALSEPVEVTHSDAVFEFSDETPLEQRRQRYAEFFEANPVGTRRPARIKNIRGTRAWVVLEDGVEAVIAPQELGWGSPQENADRLSEDDDIEVVITGFRADVVELDCSARQAMPDPAEAFFEAHGLGDVVTGVVKNIAQGGSAFVRLVDGLDGRIDPRHVAWRRDLRTEDVLAVGDAVEAKVISLHPAERKVELSLKELQPHPVEDFARTHAAGDIVSGRLTHMTAKKDLAFVDLGDGVEGRLHVTEIGWERLPDIEYELLVGDEVKAKIVEIKANGERPSVRLSMVAMLPDRKQQIIGSVGRHEEFVGTVSGLNNSFAYVDLGAKVTGKIHVRNLAAGFVNHPSDVVQRAQRVRVRPIGFDQQRGQVDLVYLGPAPPLKRRVAPPPTVVTAPTPPARPPEPVASVRPAEASAKPVVPSRPLPRPQERRVPRTAEAFGDTVEDATAKAAASLGLPVDAVSVTVLEMPRKGLLGRVRRQARVRVAERL